MSSMTSSQNAEVKIREVAERIVRLREDLGIPAEETDSVKGVIIVAADSCCAVKYQAALIDML